MVELEHANLTVTDARKTAAWMHDIFGWKIRWEGEGEGDIGLTVHCGTDNSYIALYQPKRTPGEAARRYVHRGGLNHLAVTVDELQPIHDRVVAAGFELGGHYDYEPGERFYFHDHDGIEFEVVCYS